MELDELKTAWRDMERRLDDSRQLNLLLIRETRLAKARSHMRRFGLIQTIELAVWFAMVIVAAPFWIEHRATPHFLVSGLVLHAYGVAAICIGVTQLLLTVRLRYAEPVLTIQNRLAQLCRLRSYSSLLLGLPWWLLWLPVSIVGAKLFFNVDVYSSGWVLSSLATCSVGMLLTLWYARRVACQPGGPDLMRRLADDVGGGALVRARAQLDEIERFGRD